MKYQQLTDGEEFEINIGDGLLHKCCDCGLVHRINIKLKKDKIGLTFFREDGRTRAVRAAQKRSTNDRKKTRKKARGMGPKTSPAKDGTSGRPSDRKSVV